MKEFENCRFQRVIFSLQIPRNYQQYFSAAILMVQIYMGRHGDILSAFVCRPKVESTWCNFIHSAPEQSVCIRARESGMLLHRGHGMHMIIAAALHK